MTSQPIWFDSTEAGAPGLNNAVGSLVEVLRGCLVNGFGIKSISSITVASGVATATSANHGFADKYGKLVLIEGAPVAGLNGRKQPGGITTNTFTFPAPGVPDGTYTGTISVKRAPLGWSEPYSATGKAIFARTDPAATAYMLRVDDTQIAPATAAEPRVRIVEGVTGIDSFSVVSPTEAQSAGGGRWYKGTPNATPMRWLLVGDELGFYLFLPAFTTQGGLFHQYGVYFGDFNSYLPSDAHSCTIAYCYGSHSSFGFPTCSLGRVNNNFAAGDVGTSYGLRSARSFDGASVSPTSHMLGLVTGSGNLGATSGSQTSNTLMTVFSRPMLIMDNPLTYQIRGEWPGLANRLSNLAFDAAAPWSIVPAAQGDGRAYLEVRCVIDGSVERSMMFDLTGPWHD